MHKMPESEMDEQKPVMPCRKIPNILVTGTPGTGKTTLSKLLAESLSFIYLPVGQCITENKLYKEWDSDFNVPIFDQDMLLDYIEEVYKDNIEKGGLVVDFHSSDFFPLRYFDLVILIRCGNEELHRRLTERGYEAKKIQENIDCQILEVTHDEVFEAYPEDIILELRNEERGDMEKNLGIVMQWLTQWKKKRDTQSAMH